MKQRCLFTILICAFIASVSTGCTDNDDDGEGTGTEVGPEGGNENLDWFTSSCDDLGGVLTPDGACFVGCKSDTDCPISSMTCTGASVWILGQCEVDSATKSAKGCGPEGWHNQSWGCYMSCSAQGNDQDCPSGFRCIEDSITSGLYFCTGSEGSSGGGCGSPCSDSCCSPSGLTCCEPPFCSGQCASSPCCS